jgi:BirA family transcriptional regulator, biotin operon repressor / biotin---[acetyl-CoA-carboxylase] ligase
MPLRHPRLPRHHAGTQTLKTMAEQTLQWGAEALWQQLEPLLPGLSVEVVHSTISTNTALLDRARVVQESELEAGNVQVRRSVESGAFGRRAVDVQPCLLVAENQIGGRGRQGRSWKSAPGASLTFSLSLPLASVDWSGLSLADALDVAPASATGLRIGLKWPNDLWLVGDGHEGRKLGGVLIETVAAGPQRLVVIGIGLNVLPFGSDDFASGFASLHELDPSRTAPAVLAQVIGPLVHALKRFEAEGFAAFATGFAARDLLRGRAVRTTQADAIDGVAQGVSEHGELLVQTDAGLKRVSSGEVSVRLRGASLQAPLGPN